MSFYQITSGDKDKQCSLYPFGSLHQDKDKIHYFCEIKEVNIEHKSCPICNLKYAKDHPFVISNQKGDPDMCRTCFEKKYIPNSGNYRECLKAEILMEINNKG